MAFPCVSITLASILYFYVAFQLQKARDCLSGSDCLFTLLPLPSFYLYSGDTISHSQPNLNSASHNANLSSKTQSPPPSFGPPTPVRIKHHHHRLPLPHSLLSTSSAVTPLTLPSLERRRSNTPPPPILLCALPQHLHFNPPPHPTPNPRRRGRPPTQKALFLLQQIISMPHQKGFACIWYTYPAGAAAPPFFWSAAALTRVVTHNNW